MNRDDATFSTLGQDVDLTGVTSSHPQPTTTPRRGVLAAVGALATALPLGLTLTQAKMGGKRKKHKKNRKGKQSGSVRADATCAGPADDFPSINGNTRQAQTFTAIADGALVKAELEIFKEPGSGDFVLSLNTVDYFEVPTDDLLAVTFVADAAVPEEVSTVSSAFPDPATVTAGTQYALVLTRLKGEIQGWGKRVGDVCPGRRFFSSSGNGSSPFEAINDDLVFTVFVSS